MNDEIPTNDMIRIDDDVLLAAIAAAIIITLLVILRSERIVRRARDDAFARQRRFTADASHELRAPLSVIRAEADLALRRTREPEAYRRAMLAIAEEADRMEHLIADLLTAARTNSEYSSKKLVDISEILSSACNRIMPAVTAKSATIDLQSEKRLDAFVNEGALERALMAVLHNAVKYIREQGHIWVSALRLKEHIVVTVRDDGPGFSAEALARGTERFWRGDVSRSGDSTGLGLAIACAIVESFGGEIVLTNANGGGADVRLVFPTG